MSDERVALMVTVRRTGATPLISIRSVSELPTLDERLNTDSTAEAVRFVAAWLEQCTGVADPSG